MTTIALLPLAVGCFASGILITWPLAHRAGRRSATKANQRDQAEIGRILTGFDAPALPDGQDLPVQYGTRAEHDRRQQLVAPAPEPGWHRREHRIYSWGWAVEVVQRLASIGAKAPVVEEGEYAPRHLRSVGEVTEEFDRIVVAEFGIQRCDSCTVGWDPEPTHASCPGCSCPCTVEPLPEGVEGYAIAGRTR